MKSLINIILFLLCCLALWACSQNSTILAGGTEIPSEPGKGGTEIPAEPIVIGKVLNPDSTPATNATVKVRPTNYIPDSLTGGETGNPEKLLMTDSNGYFYLDSLQEGSYIYEVVGDYALSASLNFDLQANVDHMELLPSILGEPTSVSGNVQVDTNSSDTFYVHVAGLDYVAEIDNSTGQYVLVDLPPGEFTFQIISKEKKQPIKVFDSPISSLDSVIVFDTIVIETPLPDVPDTITITDTIVDTLVIELPENHSRVKIGINTSHIMLTQTIKNFPLLIRLDSNSIPFDSVQKEWIRFYNSEEREIPFEIEVWDPVSKHASIWVKTDSIVPNSDSQHVILDWIDTLSAIDYSNGTLIFDTNTFIAVWHLNENPIASGRPALRDRTFRRLDLTTYGSMLEANSVEGMVGKAIRLDGNDDYFEGPISWELTDLPKRGFSLCFWVNHTASDITKFFSKRNGDAYGWDLGTGGSLPGQLDYYHVLDSVYTRHNTTEKFITDNEWHYMCMDYRSESAETFLYYNGMIKELNSRPGSGNYPTDHDYRFIVGRGADILGRNHVNGIMDEIQLFKGGLSEDWVKMNYESQKTNSSILNFSRM